MFRTDFPAHGGVMEYLMETHECCDKDQAMKSCVTRSNQPCDAFERACQRIVCVAYMKIAQVILNCRATSIPSPNVATLASMA